MILRDELTGYLAETYDYESFEDYCENGLQVEGKEEIETIVFGVSFNMLLLKEAIAHHADAIIVHHAVFQGGFFRVRGMLKEKIKLLIEHDISLYGIHLPMDAHPELGHNALLLNFIAATGIEPFEIGFIGENSKKYTLDKILKIFHRELHPENNMFNSAESSDPLFALSRKHGFQVSQNGPAVPGKMAVVSGESAGSYETAIELGVDTFFCGAIKEYIPAVSQESRTNFINLGHYYSEKPGVLALQECIDEEFEVDTIFIEIENPV
jgi:dinuclear metal center YbgI/SA1388 family protein